MKINKPLLIIGIIVVTILVIRTINKSRLKETKEETTGDYKTVYDISGISFDVPAKMAQNATAISEISSKIDISKDNMYVYKDGESHYLLFKMDSIVIAAQKDSKFSTATSADELLKVGSICNIWFENNGKDTDLEKADGVTFINDVSGGFVATDELFDDFTGKIAVVSDGTTEWSLFVGVRSKEKYKNLSDAEKKAIERIANSLNLSDYEPQTVKAEQYEVTINGNETTISKEEVKADDAPAEEPPEESPVEEKEDSSQEEADDGSEITIVEEETAEPVVEAPTPTPSPLPEAVEETEESNPDTEEIKKEILSVRTEKPKVDNKAYSSDIYSMLSIGNNGIITERIPLKGTDSTIIISIKDIYTGDKAVKLIKSYAERTGAYNYFEPEPGCNWQVMEYYLSYRDEETPYINIKLKGIDGQKLKFRGITYSKRSYDMNDQVKEGAFSGPYYCYYAVPNGCSEYALECGTGSIDVDTGSQAAYYLINN